MGTASGAYGRDLEERLADLHGRVHRGAYRAQPSKRAWIPKADGRQRPLGIAALEDKIVQQAVKTVLEQVYEEDFLGFSYGFRPWRSCHKALDALWMGVTHGKVNWVLDADIRGFFDNIDHEWMLRFLEHRIADRRILRLIHKWLTAGVSEDGQWTRTTVGTPQGSVISPLLANVFLHYVLDLWVHQWRKRKTRGSVIIVRYADDFVMGFQSQADAERLLRELKQRLSAASGGEAGVAGAPGWVGECAVEVAGARSDLGAASFCFGAGRRNISALRSTAGGCAICPRNRRGAAPMTRDVIIGDAHTA
jgi:RNA-directed DNA polymerase